MYLKAIALVTAVLILVANINGYITYRDIKRLRDQNKPATAIPWSRVVIHIVTGVLSLVSCILLILYVFMSE